MLRLSYPSSTILLATLESVSCGSDGNLSYTSVSCAQISSLYFVSDATYFSADVCCAEFRTDGAHRHHDRWIEGAGIPGQRAPHGSHRCGSHVPIQPRRSEHAVGGAARLHARLLSGSDVNNKAPQQWYSTESLMMSTVKGTTVTHIAVLDAGVTDIDVGFNLVMSQGIAVTIRTGSGNVARCDPVSCDRRCVVGFYTKDCESLTLWRRISMIGCIQHDMIALGNQSSSSAGSSL